MNRHCGASSRSGAHEENVRYLIAGQSRGHGQEIAASNDTHLEWGYLIGTTWVKREDFETILYWGRLFPILQYRATRHIGSETPANPTWRRLDGLVVDAWARERGGKDRCGVQYKWSTISSKTPSAYGHGMRYEWAVAGVETKALPCVGIICQNLSSGGRDVSFGSFLAHEFPYLITLVYNEFRGRRGARWCGACDSLGLG